MITALPSPPSTNDPSNFATKADALLAALPNFVTEANATAVAMNLNSTTDTSASSVAIGTGAKSFTVSAGKSFQPGMYLVIADTAAPSTNSMFGQITSYDVATGALVISIATVKGSGTKTAWTISQSSAGGAASGANSDITSLGGTALADFYKKSNILGTVSQSAGVPTGAVIERGSNANGEYVRFADGTQICTVKIAGPLNISNLTGSVYHTGSSVWNFPAAYVAAPAVQGMGDSVVGFCWVALGASPPSTTQITFDIFAAVSTASTPVASLLAVGRWF